MDCRFALLLLYTGGRGAATAAAAPQPWHRLRLEKSTPIDPSTPFLFLGMDAAKETPPPPKALILFSGPYARSDGLALSLFG